MTEFIYKKIRNFKEFFDFNCQFQSYMIYYETNGRSASLEGNKIST